VTVEREDVARKSEFGLAEVERIDSHDWLPMGDELQAQQRR